VNPEHRRLDRVTFVLLVLAAAYSVVLIAAGFLAPVYESSTSSSSGADTNGTDTLVGANGSGVVFALVIPLLVTVVVAVALLLRPRRGALPVAWTFTGLLGLFNLVAMFTIGVFVIPVTAALIIACSRSGQPGNRPTPRREALSGSHPSA
jgi:hypothetical protein